MTFRSAQSGQGVTFGALTALLLGSTVPAAVAVRRAYSSGPGSRFGAGMAVTLAVQQALVAWVLRRTATRHRLTAVDMMTLSRSAAAAVLVGLVASGVRDRRGPAGWLGWSVIIYGSIMCDWLDGPIARRLGSSDIGALFDLEADSWLTLCSAAAAVTWGDLPVYATVPPLARYGLLSAALQRMPYADIYVDESRWVRWTGIAQMMLFIAALAPFGGRATRRAVRVAAPLIVPIQLSSMIASFAEQLKRAASPGA